MMFRQIDGFSPPGARQTRNCLENIENAVGKLMYLRSVVQVDARQPEYEARPNDGHKCERHERLSEFF
jgi:hypothetical protein